MGGRQSDCGTAAANDWARLDRTGHHRPKNAQISFYANGRKKCVGTRLGGGIICITVRSVAPDGGTATTRIFAVWFKPFEKGFCKWVSV